MVQHVLFAIKTTQYTVYNTATILNFKVLSRNAPISYRNDETSYATLDHDWRNALPLDSTRSGFALVIISAVTC